MCKDKHAEPPNTPNERRKLLKMLGFAGVSMLVTRCGSNESMTSASGSVGSVVDNGTTAGGSCIVSATETNGPFPADGSNSAGDGSSTILDDVYVGTPILRSNITESQTGIALALTLSLQNVNNSCSTLSGYYIYIWHCTSHGQYSAYTGTGNGTHSRTETYLRGIAQTDSSGNVTFSTICPGWYSGRAPHIHVEIYQSLSGSPIRTTQLAFPSAVSSLVQASSGYPGLSGMVTNSSDNIFSDGTSTEMLTMSGSVASGYSGSLTLRVAV